MTKIRHLLGISGGKDSAALAIYLKTKYPQLDIEYYFCDTGKELKETYQLINSLENFLGKTIVKLRAVERFPGSPFDYYLDLYGGYLPSSRARWCTKVLKLEPFEKFVGQDPVISYVGIRGDEEREGYISKKSNIQSIFPFRKNIWSEDVIEKVLSDQSINILLEGLKKNFDGDGKSLRMAQIIERKTGLNYPSPQKLKDLLSSGVTMFNRLVLDFLKTTSYPLSQVDSFPLVDNDEVLIRRDIFNILEESGVGVPEYYKNVQFTVGDKKGYYARSRSGCFFCFFQQRIEWVWLYEQHPALFKEAMAYEESGFTWKKEESLASLIRPERIKQIKEEYLKRTGNTTPQKSGFLVDILTSAEQEGCAACFI